MSDLIPLPDPQFQFFADLRVEVGTPQEVGRALGQINQFTGEAAKNSGPAR